MTENAPVHLAQGIPETSKYRDILLTQKTFKAARPLRSGGTDGWPLYLIILVTKVCIQKLAQKTHVAFHLLARG